MSEARKLRLWELIDLYNEGIDTSIEFVEFTAYEKIKKELAEVREYLEKLSEYDSRIRPSDILMKLQEMENSK